MMTITPKQKAVLDFIREYITANETSPTYAEIMAAVGISSKSRVNQIMDGLQDRGRIRRLKGRSRAIEVLE